MEQPVAIKEWMECVKDAKAILLLPVDTFVPLKGELLRMTQQIYCSSRGY